MANLLNRYKNQITQDEKLQERAEKLVKLHNKLLPFQGELFAYIATSQAPYNPRRSRDNGPSSYVSTGMLSDLEYHKGELFIQGRPYSWTNLSEFNGPFTTISKQDQKEGIHFTNDYTILEPENKEDGIVLWNGSNFLGLEIEKVNHIYALMIGDQAVSKLLGIQLPERNDIETLYSKILEQEQLPKEEILRLWERKINLEEHTKRILLKIYQVNEPFIKLQKRINEIPYNFFENIIHDIYGVDRFEDIFDIDEMDKDLDRSLGEK
ncbi:hypothetical protein HN385_05490 [archaeon]|mgnify:CR=1 FL=1|jgi:hypothetical protein|nr:hypothetical protein [archaeon]MBT3451686.1 hypothetical protein [archaeon]MBT6869463.1 hypothetical protein [archaeon]MBT7193151.1 hypothetical protein [archaeon]MBT7380457.1 hypothetical protein [archaeon]